VEKFPARGQGLEARSGQLGVGVGGLAAGVEDFGAALPPHMAERLRLSGKVYSSFRGSASINQRRSLEIREARFSVRHSLTAMCCGKAAFRVQRCYVTVRNLSDEDKLNCKRIASMRKKNARVRQF